MAQRNMLTPEGREQKLVDLCFELVLTITHKEHAAIFAAKTNEDKAAWVAAQLRGCGFDTAPCGATWGLLKRQSDPGEEGPNAPLYGCAPFVIVEPRR